LRLFFPQTKSMQSPSANRKEMLKRKPKGNSSVARIETVKAHLLETHLGNSSATRVETKTI